MKNNSKRRSGFTLIEVIISMALIAILSIGVYNSYLMIIKITKDGEVKQISALIGKQISEEIKSTAENRITENKSSIYEITDNIHLIKNGSSFNSTPIYFNEEGRVVNSESRYIGEISLVPKLLDDFTPIVIDEFFKDSDDTVKNQNVYIIKDGESVKAVSTKTDSSNIDSDKNIAIKMTNSEKTIESSIKIDLNTPLKYTFSENQPPIINLDLRYCKGDVIISVDNETKIPLNLCILNKNNVNIEHINGVLNEYYRSEDGNKIGVLYDVTIKIIDNRSIDKKTVFQAFFAQNINIIIRNTEP